MDRIGVLLHAKYLDTFTRSELVLLLIIIFIKQDIVYIEFWVTRG